MTQILRAEGAVWPNAPQMYVDGIITPGTKYVIDCADTLSNALPSGAIANGATISNLVTGGSVWAVANADSDATVSNNQTAGFFVDSTEEDGLFAGGDNSVGGRDFVACVWFRQKTGHSTAASQAVYTCCQNTSDGTFCILTSDLTPRAFIRGVGNYVFDAAYATVEGAITQIALARQNDKFLVLRNGVLIHSADATGATLQTAGIKDGCSKIPTQVVGSFLNPFKGDIFRVWKEDLTTSGASVVAQVRKDYDMNKGRFA